VDHPLPCATAAAMSRLDLVPVRQVVSFQDLAAHPGWRVPRSLEYRLGWPIERLRSISRRLVVETNKARPEPWPAPWPR